MHPGKRLRAEAVATAPATAGVRGRAAGRGRQRRSAEARIGARLGRREEVAYELLTYDVGSGPRAGVLADEQVLDVTALLGAAETLRDVRALLELPDNPLDRLRAALAAGRRPRACR